MKWHHAGIQVRNLHEAIHFYETIFDFKVEKYLTLPGEEIAFLKKAEVRIELIKSEEPLVPSNSIHLSWKVENVEDWIWRLGEKELSPSEGPYKLENGWHVVFYEGLNDEVIELIQVGERE